MDGELEAGPYSGLTAEMAEESIIERLIVALLRREQPLLRLAPSVVDAQPF
jgi:hypothetical protein